MNSNTPLSFSNHLLVLVELEILELWKIVIICLSSLGPNTEQPDALRILKQCACIAISFWMRLKLSFYIPIFLHKCISFCEFGCYPFFRIPAKDLCT